MARPCESKRELAGARPYARSLFASKLEASVTEAVLSYRFSVHVCDPVNEGVAGDLHARCRTPLGDPSRPAPFTPITVDTPCAVLGVHD